MAEASPRIGVVGTGLVGTRTARDLVDRGAHVTLIARGAPVRSGSRAGDGTVRAVGADRTVDGVAPGVLRQLGPHDDPGELDLVVLATESMHQVEAADEWLHRGVGVVATADRPAAVRALWTLRETARRCDVVLSVGVACAPGLSTLLVERLATGFERVDAITTARFGTGGPTCAREHHRSMAAQAFEVRDGRVRWMRGGSGRTLVWFPEPAGPQDCFRAGLAEPFLLRERHGDVARVQSLQAATRRDRLTARLPMLRPPHAEGRVGAVWAEVRGIVPGGEMAHRVLAASAPQATAAAAVAAAVAWHAVRSGPTDHHPLWWLERGGELLREVATSVQLWGYDGSPLERPGSGGSIQAARKRVLPRRSGAEPPMEPPNG